MISNQGMIRQIAESYNSAFPKYPPLVCTERWLYGVFMAGNNYSNTSRFHGAYPPTVMKRYQAMFNGSRVLHLFSGSLPPGDYLRIDLIQDADVKANTKELPLKDNVFDLIFADPPYTDKDAEIYGTRPISRLHSVREAARVLQPGGLLVWLDMKYPMYSRKSLILLGTIALVRSTNHWVRMIFIFRKVA